jgi:hypothetical protein
MKTTTIVLALALLPACAPPPEEQPAAAESEVTGVPIGQIRGAADVSSTLRVRLLDAADPRSASFDVARVAGRSAFALRRQLGAFVQAGTTTEYQGGTPTPFGMMLWHQLLGRFTAAVAQTCVTGDPTIRLPAYAAPTAAGEPGAEFRLAPPVAARVAAACAFAGGEGPRRATAGALWDAVMGIGGSVAPEKAAFVDEVARAGSPLGADEADGKERVSGMLLMMLLNPHFLLNK